MENDFQNIFTMLIMEIYVGNEGMKIYHFSKNLFIWDDINISVLPIFRRGQKNIFHPSCYTWWDLAAQKVYVIDDI